MKLKYITLTAILIILLSLGTAAASENITDTVSADMDNSYSAVNENTYSDVDLSVNVNVTPSYVNEKYNTVGSEVPWTITVTANGGTAHNTKILQVLSNNLQYISHDTTMGKYDPETRIWTIGDLSPSETASMTIITKLKSAGTYTNKVYATTDAKEKNLLNNFVITSMKTGSSKVTSSVTETSSDREGSQHTVHQASMGGARFVIWEDIEDGGGGSDTDPDPDPQPDPKKNSSGSISKTISLESILNPDENESTSHDSLASAIKSIQAYDYTQIPKLIFCAFLIILATTAGYDKIKTRSRN